MKKHNHILFKLSAKLLIAASVLCVLFGNGTHMHTVFDHFSDHGKVFIYVHAHPADANHDHNSEFDGKDEHQHTTATIELEGTITQKAVNEIFTEKNIIIEAGEISNFHLTKEVNPLYFDLPPPDYLILSEYFYSHSLRAPPLG